MVHHLDACLVLVFGKGEEGRGEREGEIDMIKGIQNNVIYRTLNIFFLGQRTTDKVKFRIKRSKNQLKKIVQL